MTYVHLREFDVDHLRVDDAGQVECRVVPYGEEIQAVDLLPSGLLSYRERFTPGAFAGAVKVPNRVAFTFGHDEAFGARLGFGAAFTERDDGLYGTFTVYPSVREKVADVLGSSHRRVSAGFVSIVPRAGTEEPGSLVVRSKVGLRHVAAVEQGQYEGAQVLAVRSDELDVLEQREAEQAEQEAQREAKAVADLVAQLREQQAEWVARIG